MSRSHKVGLDYFSFDVDFFNDDKLEFVSAKYGNIGELIVIKLLCRIYKNGYYSKWGKDESLIFAKRAGDSITQDLTDEVISELLHRDFFCNDKFEQHSILTSNGIQRRFLEATKRRKSVDVAREYIIADTTDFNVNIIALNVDIKKQSKVKESKPKKRKVNQSKELNRFDFETVWIDYPNKDGKRAALKSFNSTVKSEKDYQDIQTALTNYLFHLQHNDWKKPKNGSTWFNNWQDWVTWQEPEKTQRKANMGNIALLNKYTQEGK